MEVVYLVDIEPAAYGGVEQFEQEHAAAAYAVTLENEAYIIAERMAYGLFEQEGAGEVANALRRDALRVLPDAVSPFRGQGCGVTDHAYDPLAFVLQHTLRGLDDAVYDGFVSRA